MPSNPKIPKELILETALSMLIRDGYKAINIKAVAKELHCSTQPISWQFGGMDGFRAELTEAAIRYVNQKIEPSAKNLVASFEQIGESYVDIAIDEPNLFRFIFMGESGRNVNGGLLSLLDYDRNIKIQQGLSEILQITPEQAGTFINTMVIYTHGIASLIAAGVVNEEKETAHKMVRSTGITFLEALGISNEKAEVFLNNE
ncbi:MAG: TetR family transcriptional regulator [Lachnospiraceae bacterium]|nr:TetR family transcriptional regulator [Lachnospiraceae bacterium]